MGVVTEIDPREVVLEVEIKFLLLFRRFYRFIY
jgi:hypothetical protein